MLAFQFGKSKTTDVHQFSSWGT